MSAGVNVFPIDPAATLRRLALTAAAERLGITRPVAECSRCRCSLYAGDIRCDALPCEEGCPAKTELERIFP